MLTTEKERKLARRNFSASLMSDTKWRKLFTALDRADLRIDRCFLKFTDHEHLMAMPKTAALHPPKGFIDTIEWGPVALVSIEWLEIPDVYSEPRGTKNVPPRRVTQDVERVKAILDEIGRFPVESTDRGLRIVGHRR